MRSFLAVLAYEVSQRRLPLLAAPVLGCLPFLLPVLTSSSDPRNLRVVSAVLSSLLFGWILSILIGASVIAADLKSDRLGFFFSQPVRGTTLWAAKLTAATVLAMTSAALVALPALLVDAPSPSLPTALLILASFPTLVVLAHVAAVSWHGRNALLGFDLGALALAMVIAVAAHGRMTEASAEYLAWVGSGVAVLLVLVAIVVATWVQVTRGRASLARSNRILSTGVAGFLLAAATAYWGFSSWALDPPREDLKGVRYARSHGADWIEVAGAFGGRPEYHPTILIHRHTDALLPLPGYPGPLAASWLTDGNRHGLAWWASGEGADGSLWWLDLRLPEPVPVQTGAQAAGSPFFLALSPAADRAALLSANPARHSEMHLTVHELPSGRVLATRPVPQEVAFSSSMLLLFEGESRLALVTPVVRDRVAGVARLQFDLASGRFETPWQARDLADEEWVGMGVSADGELFRHGPTVYSTRTFEPILELDPLATLSLLRHGRVATLSSSLDHPDRRLVVYDLSSRHEVPVPGPAYPHLIGELEDGRLIVSTMPYESGQREAPRTSYWLADPPAGSLVPLGDLWRMVVPGESTDLMAIDRKGGLFVIDGGTGAATELVAGQIPTDYSWRSSLEGWTPFAHFWPTPRSSPKPGESFPFLRVGLVGNRY